MANLHRGRTRQTRVAPELEGRLNLNYRRNASHLLLDSFATVKASQFDVEVFEHQTGTPEICASHNIDDLKGISALDFDSMGTNILSVTRAGCLSVYQFISLTPYTAPYMVRHLEF